MIQVFMNVLQKILLDRYHSRNILISKIKNRLFNQRLAETLIDTNTGEIIAEAGQMVDRRLLDEILPYLEEGVGSKTYHVANGVLNADDIPMQSIDVFSPIERGKYPSLACSQHAR